MVNYGYKVLTAQTPHNKQFENYGFPAIIHRPYPIESRKNCILDYHHQQSFYIYLQSSI